MNQASRPLFKPCRIWKCLEKDGLVWPQQTQYAWATRGGCRHGCHRFPPLFRRKKARGVRFEKRGKHEWHFSLAGQTCRRRNQKGTIIFSFYISFQLYRLRFNAYCLNLKQCKLELTFSFKVSERFYMIVDYRTSCKWFEIVFFQRRRRDGKKFKLTKRNTKQGARKKGNDCNVFSFSHLILSVVLIVDSLIWWKISTCPPIQRKEKL